MMSLNPYETPPDISAEDALRTAVPASDDEEDPVALKINIPAFALSVTASMRLIFDVPFLLLSSWQAIETLATPGHLESVVEWLLPMAIGGVATWFDYLTIRGANAMQAQRHLGRARLGAALAIVPVSPMVLLQWPFGLWSLRVLADREVVERFRS